MDGDSDETENDGVKSNEDDDEEDTASCPRVNDVKLDLGEVTPERETLEEQHGAPSRLLGELALQLERRIIRLVRK